MEKIITVKILESKFVIDLMPTPNVLSVSDGVDDLLGFTADDFLAGKIVLQSRIHPHDQDIAAVLFSSEIVPASGIFNIRLRHADGRIRCLRGQYSKIINHTGNGIALELLLQDAKSLWQQQGDQTMMDNFKAMMDNTDDYIYFKDRNHVFTGASETLVAITDPTEHWTDLIGQTDYDVFPESFADIYYSLEKQVFAGLHNAHEEQETLDKTGGKGWVDNRKYPIKNDNGEIIGLFGIARDITERKKVEYALKENEKRLALATFHNGIGIWDLNLQTQELVCDDLTLALYNKKREEFNNSVNTWMGLLHPDDLASSYQNIQNAISGRVPFNHEFRVIWPNGEIHHIQAKAKIFLDDTGNPIRMLGTNADITERKLAEFQTNLINERSQHLLKLESFSEQMTEIEFMQHGQELAENITGSRIAFIHFVNDDEETIELVTWSRRTIEHYCHAAFDKHYPVSQAGIWADALRTKQSVMFNDYASFPHKHGLPEGHSPLHRLISVPVIENGKVVMLTGVGNKETDYSEIDIESVQLISNDIWRLVQRRRTERDQFITATVFESREGMVVTDSDSIILRVNHAFTRITGYSAEEALGQTPRLLKSGKHDKAFYTAMWECLNSQGHWEGEIWNRRKSGDVYPEQLTITTVKDASGIATNYVATLADITERKQAELLLNNKEQQLNFVLESSDLGFWDWDITSGQVQRNHIWAEMLGYTDEEIKLTTNQWADFVHPDDIQNAWESINDALEGRTLVHELVYRMRTKNGEYKWILDRAKVVQRDEYGKAVRMTGSHADYTQRKNLELELSRQAHLDYLTGLSNRRHFMAQGEVELSRAIRYGKPLSLLMLDIDHFKNVNDTYGHQVGDTVLQALSEISLATMRQVDVVGRLGGEEFAVILPETEANEAIEVAERLREAVAKMEVTIPVGLPIHFTVSIGITTLNNKDVDIDMLLNQADKALYVAKETGRNKVCIG